MGAEIPTEEEMLGLEEYNEFETIDLGCVAWFYRFMGIVRQEN